MKRLKIAVAGILGMAALAIGGALQAQTPALPYRFLLVINDQWKDPGSEVIGQPGELSMLCALLKSWGLPFDIYRLDQQRFDSYHLLGRSGGPLHSTIIWDAPGAKLTTEESALVRSLVADDGVGLIAFSDTIETPVIAELTGMAAKGRYLASDGLSFVGEHFITRGVAPPADPPVKVTKQLSNPWKPGAQRNVGGVEVEAAGATVIARRGAHPALAVQRLPGGAKTVWFDAERSTAQIVHQEFRDLFKRSLVWANGYALYSEYRRGVMLFMDDMGASDKTFYPGWHYRSLSEDAIKSDIIAPLQRHKAVLTQDVVTGFVDRRTHRILDPWTQTHVVDEMDPGIIHDYASTKRGLDDGLAAGVFEIQSHGWTHMSPDLDSPPGPLWSAPPLSLVVQQNWYKEFGDYVRKTEVPAIVQRLHIQRSLDYLRDDFGVRPVALVTGGGYGSDSPANNTMRIAAKMGFGIVSSDYYKSYAGEDVCFPLEPVSPRIHWQYDVALPGAEVPWTIDAPVWIGMHDRDVAMDGASFARLLDHLGGGERFLTFGEYCGYLHAQVDRATELGSPLVLRVSYDPLYCGYFQTHASSWVLHLSDDARQALGPSAPEKQTIAILPGLGEHRVAPTGRAGDRADAAPPSGPSRIR